jgi:hypothetical protein
MVKAEARTDKVRAQRGFFVVGQKSVIAGHHRGTQGVTQGGASDWSILRRFCTVLQPACRDRLMQSC